VIGVGGRGGGGSGGRADVDNAGAEFDADGHVVLGDEAPFAEADCELGGEVISNGVGDAGEWGNGGMGEFGGTLDFPVPLSPMQTSLAM